MTSPGLAQTARDLMLVTPKTLAPDVTVAEARAALANPHVQMLLVSDGTRFCGAITHIPETASPGEAALDHADREVDAIGPDEPVSIAVARAKASHYRRVVVLDADGQLLGLLCLNRKHTGFCGGAPLVLDE